MLNVKHFSNNIYLADGRDGGLSLWYMMPSDLVVSICTRRLQSKIGGGRWMLVFKFISWVRVIIRSGGGMEPDRICRVPVVIQVVVWMVAERLYFNLMQDIISLGGISLCQTSSRKILVAKSVSPAVARHHSRFGWWCYYFHLQWWISIGARHHSRFGWWCYYVHLQWFLIYSFIYLIHSGKY